MVEHVTQGASVAQSRADELSHAFRAAAQAVLPAVVQIRGSVRMATPQHSPMWSDSIFEDAPQEESFSDTSPGMGRQPLGNSPEPALGSGIIIDRSGIVLTNNHLVEDVDELFVQTADNQRFPVIDVRTAAASDLAVLKIHGQSSLPAARLGNSDRLQIGDWVLTIGSPLDLRQTVSAGIISATERKLEGAGMLGFCRLTLRSTREARAVHWSICREKLWALRRALRAKTGATKGLVLRSR